MAPSRNPHNRIKVSATTDNRKTDKNLASLQPRVSTFKSPKLHLHICRSLSLLIHTAAIYYIWLLLHLHDKLSSWGNFTIPFRAPSPSHRPPKYILFASNRIYIYPPPQKRSGYAASKKWFIFCAHAAHTNASTPSPLTSAPSYSRRWCVLG